MTPNQEDMAFVLEGVPGVRAVYAVAPRTGAADELELVIKVESDQRCVVAVHYALLKIIRHEECRRVAIVEESSKAPLEDRSTEIHLSSPARFAAMNRVSARVLALAEERRIAAEAERTLQPAANALTRVVAAVLVFSKDPALEQLAREAFPFATIESTYEFGTAVKAAKFGVFGLVLCPAEVAFGVWGFLECVSENRPALAQEVVLVADERNREVVAMGLSTWKRSNRCLWKPVTVESLRLIAMAPFGHEVVNVPAVVTPPAAAPAVATDPFPRAPPSKPTRPNGPKPIVLLVDDEPDTEALPAAMAPGVHVIRVSNEWDALDKLALSAIDLIVCSASMKVAGDKPLYRVLWNVRPELKKCCTLIISPHRVPASARDGRTRGAITRPVTGDMIRELLTSL